MIKLSPWSVGFDHFTDWRINKRFHTMPDYRDTRKEEEYRNGLKCAKFQLRNFGAGRKAAVFLTVELARGLGVIGTPDGGHTVGLYGLPCKVYATGNKLQLHTYALDSGELRTIARYRVNARHKAIHDAFLRHATIDNEGLNHASK